MKHLTILPFLALFLSMLCTISCSSEDENIIETQNGGVIVTPKFLSSDDITDISDFADSTYWIEFNEDGTQSCSVPVIMLDSIEFYKKLQQENLIELPILDSRNVNSTVEIRPSGSFYQVSLSLRGMCVKYETRYSYQFPTDMKVYRASYQCAQNEQPGKAYGHVRSDSEVDVYLKIYQEISDTQLEYVYTVGMRAIIRNKKFDLSPLADL